jgi:hypothetical protein
VFEPTTRSGGVLTWRGWSQRVSWSSSSKGNGEGRDRKGDSYNLTKEKYEHYIRIVQKNQTMLKKFADSAPCNYSHQYILVEVQPPPLQREKRKRRSSKQSANGWLLTTCASGRAHAGAGADQK